MKRTTIMADEAVLEKIGRIAYKTGKSKAHIIREALIEYVTDHESASSDEAPWPSNPALGLIGIAGYTDENRLPIDLSDGKDEALLQEILSERFDATQTDVGSKDVEDLESAG